MLQKPYFYRFRNSQHINFNQALIDIIEKYNPVILFVKDVFDAFKEHYLSMKTVFVPEQGSSITPEIENKDIERDSLYIGLKNVILAYNRHFNPDKLLAAKELTAHLKKYGKGIPDLEYNAETAVLQDLIEGIEEDADLTAHTVTIGVNDWFAELKAVNDAFNQLYELRIEKESKKTKLKLTDLREESVKLYRTLADHFHAASIMHPAPVFTEAENEINEMINKYNSAHL